MKDHYVYAVVGSGMQGTAEGYDLARFGRAERIYMADIHKDAADAAADTINRLTESKIAVGIALDARHNRQVSSFLKDVDTCCAATHYQHNFDLARAAILAGCNFCDLGGNTTVVQRQHSLHADALAHNVTVIPDCGLAPGLGNILAARAIEKMECLDIQIRCGGLPQNRDLLLGYRIVFSIEGLTNEYTGMCVEIRDGAITEVPAFSECESILFPEPVGQCEAFLTSGGTSTGPYSFHGKVQSYGYKTVRYPGHFDKIRAMIDLGFLNTEPIRVKNIQVIPRDVFHVLANARLAYPDEKDLVILRVTSTGFSRDGHPLTMVQEMMDFYDPRTGFSAMERTTAFSAAIVAIMITQNECERGVLALEKAVNGDFFVEQLGLRGITVFTKFLDDKQQGLFENRV